MKNRLPVWFKQKVPGTEALRFSALLKNRFKLNTVCHSAKCPNSPQCFEKRQATFLILGERCSRNCKFCNIEYGFTPLDQTTQRYSGLDTLEPFRVAEAVKFFNLRYVVITSVTRDDLSEGGAGYFAQTIKEIKKNDSAVKVEVLIPDFKGSYSALQQVVAEGVDILSHNLETVKNLYPLIRPQSNYVRCLTVLKNAKIINPHQLTKSSLMLGLGETEQDLKQALLDLRGVGCDMLVLGQYLRPSLDNYPVKKFYTPQEFNAWTKFARGLGFKSVCSLPLARTSYLAEEQQRCMM